MDLTFSDEVWDTTTTGATFILPEYAGGWLRIVDNEPGSAEDTWNRFK